MPNGSPAAAVPPGISSLTASQVFPFGSPGPPSAENLTYAFGGTNNSVSPIGCCMLSVPREWAKSNMPVKVNETDMLSICVVIVVATRAVCAPVWVTAAVRASG